MLLIYTTCESEKEAEALGKIVLDNKLGACVDYWPINTMYNWEGKREHHKEAMLTITTFEPKLDDLTDLLTKHHSYSIPMIAGMDIRRINRPYKEWMMQEVG